jgi:hypothetical protein
MKGWRLRDSLHLLFVSSLRKPVQITLLLLREHNQLLGGRFTDLKYLRQTMRLKRRAMLPVRLFATRLPSKEFKTINHILQVIS